MIENVQELPTPARQGAAEVLAASVDDSLNTLPLLLNDNDPEVRRRAARAMRHIDQITRATDLDALLDAFVTSQAFPDHMENLINTLKNMSTTLPAKTIDIC